MFGADLHGWSVTTSFAPALWDDDAMAGSQLYLRAKSTTHGATLMTFDRTTDPLSCLNASTGWAHYRSTCSAERGDVFRIETNDFIPFVDRGKIDCPHDGNGCTQCMDDVVGSFQGLFRGAAWETGNHIDRDWTYDLDGYPIGSGHIQGIARMPNWEDSLGYRIGRTFTSHDQPAQLHVWAELPSTTSPELNSSWAYPAGLVSPSPSQELQHAGGIFAAGDIVAVPLECISPTDGHCPTPIRNEVVFYRADGLALTEINRLSFPNPTLSGEANPAQFAQSVAFTRLRGGKYLLFVADYGKSGGVFFVSDDEELSPSTTWALLNRWVPINCNDVNAPSCYNGASSVTMFTQCDGRIFVQLYNGESSWGALALKESWVNVFEIDQDHASGFVNMIPVDRRYVRAAGLWGDDERTYHNAGTSFLSERGSLVGHAIEKHFDSNDEANVGRLFECSEDPGQMHCP